MLIYIVYTELISSTSSTEYTDLCQFLQLHLASDDLGVL